MGKSWTNIRISQLSSLLWKNHERRYYSRWFRWLLFFISSCCFMLKSSIYWKIIFFQGKIRWTLLWLLFQSKWYLEISFSWWLYSMLWYMGKKFRFFFYKWKWIMGNFTRKSMGKIEWKLCSSYWRRSSWNFWSFNKCLLWKNKI